MLQDWLLHLRGGVEQEEAVVVLATEIPPLLKEDLVRGG